MRNRSKILFCAFLLFTFLGFVLPKDVFAEAPNDVSKQQGQPTAEELVSAVNALRLAYGLAPLNTHPILMQIAQAEANGIANGAGGHWRPDNVTLGQWLIMLGYPLSGDLSLDGYRSENWVAASTVDEAISAWLSDEPHTNTMLSPNRSDIGAGVAVGDQVYLVIETALQTNTGQQQSDAYDILTGIPMTQAVYSGSATQSVADGFPEYVIPVMRSTARPDGDVFHKVQNGQTLWSIAVTYGTTINRLRALNNLGLGTIVYPDQVLLVQKGATQPAPVTATVSISSPMVTSTLSLNISAISTPVLATVQDVPVAQDQGPSFGFVMGILIFAVVVIVIIAAWLIREPE